MNIDWTMEVDRALAKLGPMTASEAEARYGISAAMIIRWRRMRREGVLVKSLRAHNRNALLRLVDTEYESGSIPISERARFRSRALRDS